MEGLELLDQSIRRAKLAQYPSTVTRRPPPVIVPIKERAELRTLDLERQINELTRRIELMEARFSGEVMSNSVSPAAPTMKRIAAHTAFHFGLSVDDIMARRNDKRLSFPRQIAMYLCKTMTLQSYPQIGEYFNRRDHTTILSAFRKIDAMRVVDAVLDQAIFDIQRALKKPIAAVE